MASQGAMDVGTGSYGARTVQARTYSDEELADAIAESGSWRGVLRAVGLRGTSAAAMRSVRTRADRLGIDDSHFRGQRRWTEDGLRAAVAHAGDWVDVVEDLGLGGRSSIAAVKGHAARLGLDTTHLAAVVRSTTDAEPRPDTAHLDRAGSLLAAAWFTLCGHDVSWPCEPCRYDLLVDTGAGIRRVQVKTTTARAGGTWKAYLSTSRGARRTYDPDEIDDFFVIDGDLTYFLIPVTVVGGLQALHVSSYAEYRVGGAPMWSPHERSGMSGR